MTDDSRQADADLQLQLEAHLARAVLGDRAAFKRLYDLTASRIYGLGIRMLGAPDAADDLLQETFIRVWSRASEYHAERGSVLAWMTSIARYRALDMLRADAVRRRPPPADHDSRMFSITPDTTPSRLRTCLEGLADSQRESIVAAFFEGLTHGELAERLASPLGTVKSRIRRGLARLKECLEQ